MVTGEIIEALAADGLKITRGGIEYALRGGKVSPVPIDGAGNRHFTQRHLDELRAYLRTPRKPGRKPRAERAADRRQLAGAEV
jgi:hypothetical protein